VKNLSPVGTSNVEGWIESNDVIDKLQCALQLTAFFLVLVTVYLAVLIGLNMGGVVLVQLRIHDTEYACYEIHGSE
jgi:hypothetical protein